MRKIILASLLASTNSVRADITSCVFYPQKPVYRLTTDEYCPQSTKFLMAITSFDGIDREQLCFDDENDYYRWMSGKCVDIKTVKPIKTIKYNACNN
jgi:hypothetical protein